jgi:heme A synthase
VPSGRFGLAAPFVSAAKWLVLWAAVEVALEWGHRTRFGAGLLGATVPLLVVEAWLTMRRRWRVRLLDTLAFAVPLGAFLALAAVVPSSCCFCDHSPWAKTLRNLEFIAEFLYFSAYATLPAFALLVVLWRRSRSGRERAAYSRTTVTALLAMLSCAVVFAAGLRVMTCQFDDIDTFVPERPGGAH